MYHFVMDISKIVYTLILIKPQSQVQNTHLRNMNTPLRMILILTHTLSNARIFGLA